MTWITIVEIERLTLEDIKLCKTYHLTLKTESLLRDKKCFQTIDFDFVATHHKITEMVLSFSQANDQLEMILARISAKKGIEFCPNCCSKSTLQKRNTQRLLQYSLLIVKVRFFADLETFYVFP